MLRVVFAALAGGIALRLWALASTALLPWPVPAIGSVRHPIPSADVVAAPLPPEIAPPATDLRVQVDSVEIDRSLQPPAFGPAELPPIPNRRNGRSNVYRESAMPIWHRVGMDLAVGLTAALAALMIPASTTWFRQITLLVLGGLFAVLLADLSLAARVDWPGDYLFVLCLDHFVSILLVAVVVTVTMRMRLPSVFDGRAGNLNAPEAA